MDDNNGAGRFSPEQLGEAILRNLPYEPTGQQMLLLAALSRFCAADLQGREAAFILSGYAGTGKTSLTGALVRALGEMKVPVILMAPTGRAAKVFGAFAGTPASTIHRRIYRHDLSGMWAGPGMLSENTARNAVFIVDEASMIGNDSDPERGSQGLLEDLVQYVFSGDNCRMILLGDTAQLPPVGCELSPAMSPEQLRAMGLKVSRAVMTETVRQASGSGILYNATWLRHAMSQNPFPEPQLRLSGYDDVKAVGGEDLLDEITSCYGRDGMGETLIVTRSNRRAVDYNLAVRSQILERDSEICRDERLLVVKNNYIWSRKVKGLDFVANGDMAVVNRIYGTEQKYGFRFADVSLHLSDHDIDFDCKLILDTLTSEAPALTRENYALLWERIISDPELFLPSVPMESRVRQLRTDPYFNALQVKYAYAVTCHKAQGGQWANVFVDMGYIPPEAQGLDFYRWLYTSTTRATRRLYYINPAIAIK